VTRDPSQPNLRQVHLIHAELHDELRASGFDLEPGQMGENLTTRGIDLLALPTGTRLHLGETAVVEVTGLRNPCAQLDRIQPGLMAARRARSQVEATSPPHQRTSGGMNAATTSRRGSRGSSAPPTAPAPIAEKPSTLISSCGSLARPPSRA